MIKESKFEDRLRALHEVANSLSLEVSVNGLCRRAAELGHKKLGFDRLSIWFIDKDMDFISGSFGVNEDGEIREETLARVSIGNDPSLVNIRNGSVRSILENGVKLRDDFGKVVGEGSRMVAAIWDGKEVVGYLFRDNLLSHQELTDSDRDLLELFAATLGHLYTLRRSEEELKRAYEKLQDMQYQLIQAAKMKIVGSLASGVAHEVKNPLAIIHQCVDYLSHKTDTEDENIIMAFERMKGAIKRADSIIKGLLDFAALSRLERNHEDVNSIIYESLDLVRYELDKHHISVTKYLEKELPNIYVDRNKIEQVLVNLFLNAINHMKSGGDLTVRTYAGFSGDKTKKVFVDVEDTGTGIPDTILDKIFDPFFTTRRMDGGTGLGLSIVKGILDMHEARIGIVNKDVDRGVKAVIAFNT